MMPTDLLTDEETEERESLPYPQHELRYWYFFEKNGWDKAKVDSQPRGYTSDLFACQEAANSRDELTRKRYKPDNDSDGDEELPEAKGKSLAQIRELYGYDESVPLEAIAELIGRKV